jgi:hypothetical protein
MRLGPALEPGSSVAAACMEQVAHEARSGEIRVLVGFPNSSEMGHCNGRFSGAFCRQISRESTSVPSRD